MTIGPALAGDRDTVIALWAACGLTRPWNDPAQDFVRAIDGATSTILVSRDEDAIVGAVMAGYDGHRGWIYYLAVAPDARRRGLATGLMAAATAWLAGQGAPKIQLMVRDGNDVADGFYRALGFEPQPVTTWGRFIDGGGA